MKSICWLNPYSIMTENDKERTERNTKIEKKQGLCKMERGSRKSEMRGTVNERTRKRQAAPVALCDKDIMWIEMLHAG